VYQPALALSPDGRYLAQRVGDRLIVDDLAAGRLIATVDLPASARGEVRFPGNRVLRVFTGHALEEGATEESIVRILDVDLQTGELHPPVEFALRGSRSPLPSSDGRRFLLWDQEGAVRLHDGATGEVLAEVAPGIRRKRLAFLADGRILVALPHPRGTELRVLQPDGSGELRRHLLAGVQFLGFGGQPSPASLVLATSTEKVPPFQWQAIQLDLETGRSRPLAKGLQPVYVWGTIPGPESLASTLFRRDKALVLLDLSTGKEQALTGEGAIWP
jgi:hypothetical protein